jgi:hypothetical protein
MWSSDRPQRVTAVIGLCDKAGVRLYYAVQAIASRASEPS